jgi:hypothetical protein
MADTIEQIYQKAAGGADTSITDLYKQKVATGLEDPYVRGLALRGISASPGIISPEGFESELAKRRELATQAITLPAQEQLKAGLTEVEKAYQRSGKISSSATTRGMLATTQEFNLATQAKLAETELGLREGLAAERDSELNRIYQSALAQMQGETGLLETGLGAETSMGIARLGAASDRAVAQLQSETQTQIANIERDTALSAQEKQLQIAQLQAETDLKIAQLQSETVVKTTGMTTSAQKDIAKLGSETEITKTGMTIGAEKEIAYANIRATADNLIKSLGSTEKIAFAELQQDMAKFDLSRTDDMTKFWKNIELQLDLNATDKEYKQGMLQLARDEFNQKAKEFTFTSAESVRQFNDNLEIAKEKLNLDEFQVKEATQLARDQFIQSVSQWNIETTEQTKQFWETFHEGKRQFQITTDQQFQMAQDALRNTWNIASMQRDTDLEKFHASFDLAQEQFKEDVKYKANLHALELQKFYENQREYNITTTEGTKRYWENFALEIRRVEDMEKTGSLARELQQKTYDLAVEQFKEDSRRFDLTRTDGVSQFYASLQQNRELAQMSDATTRELTQAGFDLQWNQFKVTTTTQYGQWAAQFNETARQFNISVDEQHWYATQMLSLQAKELQGTLMGNAINDTLNVLNSPGVLEYLKTADGTAQANNALAIEAILQVSADGGGLNVNEMAEWNDKLNDNKTGVSNYVIPASIARGLEYLKTTLGDNGFNGLLYGSGSAPVQVKTNVNPWGAKSSDVPANLKSAWNTVVSGNSSSPGYLGAFTQLADYFAANPVKK